MVDWEQCVTLWWRFSWPAKPQLASHVTDPALEALLTPRLSCAASLLRPSLSSCLRQDAYTASSAAFLVDRPRPFCSHTASHHFAPAWSSAPAPRTAPAAGPGPSSRSSAVALATSSTTRCSPSAASATSTGTILSAQRASTTRTCSARVPASTRTKPFKASPPTSPLARARASLSPLVLPLIAPPLTPRSRRSQRQLNRQQHLAPRRTRRTVS